MAVKRSTIGALLLLFLGAAAVLAWYFLRPRLFEWGQRRIRGTMDLLSAQGMADVS